jgi:predicted transposase/invertase (TIGR01784 family)
MITDPIFYRLFETCPETFFEVLGMNTDAAREMAARYQYEALEFKETSQRVDGIFRPRKPGLPLYVAEVQFYRLPTVFADLLAKVYTYLKGHDPGQPYHGVVLFPTRSLEPRELVPYQPLLDAGYIRRFYLDEMPELANASVGLALLHLIGQPESEAPKQARVLIARTKNEVDDAKLRASLIELIETVILYKLPRLSREEVQTMLQVSDIRETRVWQEAKEEGLQEGMEKGMEKGIEKGIEKGMEQERRRAIKAMASAKIGAEDIARLLGLSVEFVRDEVAKLQP